MTRPDWRAISGKYISIDHGETPQVFRAATDAEMELMRAAPKLLEALRGLVDTLDEQLTSDTRMHDVAEVEKSVTSARVALLQAEGEK